ncbi:MAG: cation diffusion facilitator family transporter [Thermoleophilia bacterium]
MSRGHDHGVTISAAGRHRRPLLIALVLTGAFLVVEVVVGVAIGSLALLSDAGHMLTDVAGLGMALAAIQVAGSRRSPSATFGLYRLEILAALVNAVLLVAVAVYVLYEAWRRFDEPTDVPGGWLLVVAIAGLAVNVVSFRLLRDGAAESLNMRGASLEVLSDLLGSLGVTVAALVLLATGWPYIDPIVGVAIGVLILPRAWRLGRDALRVLLQISPAEVEVPALERRLASVPGVAGVHDLHVWTLTSGLRVASAHLDVDHAADSVQVLRQARAAVGTEAGIEPVTLQLEPAGFDDTTDVTI